MKRTILNIFAITIIILTLSNNLFAQNNSKNFSDSLLTLCKKYYNEGDFKEAVEVYKETEFDKLSAEELFYIGLANSNLCQTINSIRYFKKAVELAPAHNGYKLQLARNLSQLGKINDAVSVYKHIIQKDSNNAATLFELGLIFFDKHNYDKSIEIFGKLIKINGNDFLSSYYLGYAMLLSPNPGLADSATKHLEHAVATNSEYVPAISLLASNNFGLQKYYEAKALYNMARKLRPENADFNFKTGLCFERLKQYGNAISLYSKAVELDSNEAGYFDHLGFAHFNLGNYDSAIAAYKNAAAIEDNPQYYINLGYTYAKIDSTEKSIESFRKALQFMQFDKIGNIYNQIGAVYYSKKNYKESKSAYEKALVYNPGNVDAQFYIAMINEKLSDWKNASLAYKKVIEFAAGDSLQTERIDFSNKRIKELKKRIH